MKAHSARSLFCLLLLSEECELGIVLLLFVELPNEVINVDFVGKDGVLHHVVTMLLLEDCLAQILALQCLHQSLQSLNFEFGYKHLRSLLIVEVYT